jgi:hypothetical protein
MKCKFILSFIVLILSMLALLSCNSGNTPKNGNDPSNPENLNADNINENAGNPDIQEQKPDIPDIDMKDKEITFAILDWFNYHPLDIIDISVEELIGESFNDSAYNRNLYMEQTYNCKINSVIFPDCNGDLPKVIRTIKAGDETYDVCLIRSSFYLSALKQAVLQNLDNLPYINLNNPWWDKKSIDVMSLGGNNYAYLGDYTTAIMNCVWNTYFNKKLIGDFGLENPYNLVKDGKWTIDKMYEMGKGAAADLDNNDKRDTNDRYGIAHIVDSATSLLNSFGERCADVDSDNMPYITLGKESAIEKFMRIVEIFKDHDVCFNAHFRTSDASKYEAQMFINNQALFCLGGIYYGPEMRAMEEEYGILPYPKYDENQNEYYNSTLIVALPFLTVPVTNSDIENMGAFLEMYSYQGYKNVRPQFYDVLLQRKVARDNESADMLDFIFNNIFMDIGALYNFGGISEKINDMNGKGDTNIISYLEKNIDKINNDIQNFVDAITTEE